MSAANLAPVVPLPAPLEWDAVSALLDEHADDLTRWLRLVTAAQRDFVELARHLPAHALASVQARALADAVETLHAKLRDELIRALLIATADE